MTPSSPPPPPIPPTPQPPASPPAGSNAPNGVYNDDQRKHLEFIQAVVARLASNQFLFKGWVLTISVAVFGYAAAHYEPAVAIVGLFIICGFAGLDMFFLRQERLFRHVWKAAVDRDIAIYAMNPQAYGPRVRYFRSDPDENGTRRKPVVLSPPILGLYGMLLAGGLVLAIAIRASDSTDQPSPQPAPPSHSQAAPSPTPSR